MNEYQKHELETTEEKSGFFPLKDLEGLTWTFRKIKVMQARIDEIEEVAELECERIEKWREEQVYSLQKDIDYFSSHAKAYLNNEMQKDNKLKSIKTPYGTVKSTTRKMSVEQVDKESLLRYAEQNSPEHVKTEIKTTIDWASLKGKLNIVEKGDELIVIDENGQQVEGVGVKPGETKFTLEVE